MRRGRRFRIPRREPSWLQLTARKRSFWLNRWRQCGQGSNKAIAATATVVLGVCESGEKVDSAYPDIDIDVKDAANSLQSLMWRNVGIVREANKLDDAMSKIKFWARYMVYRRFTSTHGWELQNMMTVARMVVDSAIARTESRGVHFRKEYQKTDPTWVRHIYLER